MILTSFQACQKCSSPLWPWAAMLIGPFPPRYLSSRPYHLSLPCGNLEVLQRPQLLDCWDFVARYLGHMDGSIQHKKNIQKCFNKVSCLMLANIIRYFANMLHMQSIISISLMAGHRSHCPQSTGHHQPWQLCTAWRWVRVGTCICTHDGIHGTGIYLHKFTYMDHSIWTWIFHKYDYIPYCNPKDPRMVHLPTWLVDFYGKCR